ncbi:MAG: hypothetical protein ACRYGC_12150 [Janthinobacterium lividum]
MPSDGYTWTTSTGGTWSSAANWTDTSTGVTGAGVPDSASSVTLVGPAGASVQQIYGPGQASAALFLNSSGLSGTYAFGSLAIGNASLAGGMNLNAGASVSVAGPATLLDGAVLVATGAQLTVGGTLTLGGTGAAQPTATLDVGDGGHALLAGLQLLPGVHDNISIEGTGSLEIGAGGQAVAGAVVVDTGALVSGAGTIGFGGTVTNYGTILATGGVLSLGRVSGSGTLAVAAGASLDLEGGTSGAISIAMAANSVLEFGHAAVAPSGVITGFAPGDTILDRTDAVTVSATRVSANLWSLSILNGAQVQSTLSLAGNYDGDVFSSASNGAGGTSITVSAPGTGGTGTGGGGTGGGGVSAPTSGDTAAGYTWFGGNGSFSVGADWVASATGSTAATPPGATDSATITGGQGSYVLVGGTGQSRR